MDKFVQFESNDFLWKRSNSCNFKLCMQISCIKWIYHFTYILKTLGKSFYRWKQHTHSQWKSLNIQSIFSQISVYVLALRLGGEMSSGSTLHYTCDVYFGVHICILHMKKDFIYFYLISTMGRFVFLFISHKIAFSINETETTAIQLLEKMYPSKFYLILSFYKI